MEVTLDLAPTSAAAHATASQRPTWTEQSRRAAVRDALRLILAGQPGMATYHLVRETERLARYAPAGVDDGTAWAMWADCMQRMENPQ